MGDSRSPDASCVSCDNLRAPVTERDFPQFQNAGVHFAANILLLASLAVYSWALMGNNGYAEYMERVRWRFVPGLI